jgi:hypothetical protein
MKKSGGDLDETYDFIPCRSAICYHFVTGKSAKVPTKCNGCLL